MAPEGKDADGPGPGGAAPEGKDAGEGDGGDAGEWIWRRRGAGATSWRAW